MRPHAMRRALDRLYDAAGYLAAFFLVATLFWVGVGVVGRFLNFYVRGNDAYAGYAMAAALFFALPGTLLRGEHIRVTLLLQRLPAAWRAALEWWCLAVGAALCLALAWYACRLVWVSWATHDVSPASDATPLWLPQLAMALGCVGLAVAMLDALLHRLRGRPFFAAGGDAASHVE